MNLLRLSNRIGIAHIRPATTITPTRIPKRSYAFSGYGDGDKPQGDEPAAESTRAREHPGNTMTILYTIYIYSELAE